MPCCIADTLLQRLLGSTERVKTWQLVGTVNCKWRLFISLNAKYQGGSNKNLKNSEAERVIRKPSSVKGEESGRPIVPQSWCSSSYHPMTYCSSINCPQAETETSDSRTEGKTRGCLPGIVVTIRNRHWWLSEVHIDRIRKMDPLPSA
jgi:hypothetical protein